MVKIYNDDCLNVFKTLKDESIDLIITDCPYHIVSGGCKGTTGGILDRSNKNVRQGKLFEHNDIKFSEWLPECYRVLRQNTHIYIYINGRNLAELQNEAEKVGFEYQQTLVWDKGNVIFNRYYMNAVEFILMLRKGNAKTINNPGTSNILRVPNILGNKVHPTQKPVELWEILIENSSNPNDLVLDPFCGSGTSGVACKKLNRDYIGVEIDEEYYNVANKLLSNPINKRLFKI